MPKNDSIIFKLSRYQEIVDMFFNRAASNEIGIMDMFMLFTSDTMSPFFTLLSVSNAIRVGEVNNPVAGCKCDCLTASSNLSNKASNSFRRLERFDIFFFLFMGKPSLVHYISNGKFF